LDAGEAQVEFGLLKGTDSEGVAGERTDAVTRRIGMNEVILELLIRKELRA
jgi:hypothetical protein